MTILAQTIIDRAEATLLDSTNVLWSAAELLDYLNAGVAAIAASKPDVSVTTTNVTLTSGTPKQSLPADGIQLLDVIRNTSAPYTAIRQIERNHLNHIDVDWANTTGSAVKHFVYDKRNPKIFWVYPTPSTGFQIEIVYASVPTRLTLVSQNIPVDDIYENALYFFVLALAYAKNAKRGDLFKAQAYFSAFANSIGVRQVQYAFSPTTPVENPTGDKKQGPTE